MNENDIVSMAKDCLKDFYTKKRSIVIKEIAQKTSIIISKYEKSNEISNSQCSCLLDFITMETNYEFNEQMKKILKENIDDITEELNEYY
jgi:hypothetical protein